jgi:uncharacterized membrane protein YcfT
MPTGFDAAFFGLQTEIRAADRAQMALPAFVNFVDLSPAIGDFVDTPWYPSMRLFRQTTAGDWGGVLQRVGVALRGDYATA